MIKTCPVCKRKKEMLPRQIYCSKKCGWKARQLRIKERQTKALNRVKRLKD